MTFHSKAMNAMQFYEAVREMRQAQRAFFKTRDYGAMREAQRLERIIDAEIERADAKLAKMQPVQLELFKK